jgi:hypothetical protein
MNTTLWIVQGLLGFAMLASGSMKMIRSKEQLAAKMTWVEDFSPSSIRLIGLSEVLGALGVVLPAATGILPILTPIAAAGLLIIMLGAVYTHVRRKESGHAIPSLVLAGLATLIAYGRCPFSS